MVQYPTTSDGQNRHLLLDPSAGMLRFLRGRDVDIVGVTGSNPVAPTILFKELGSARPRAEVHKAQRRPRRQGIPPSCFGSAVMRVNLIACRPVNQVAPSFTRRAA